MSDKEVEEIQASYMEVVETLAAKGGKTKQKKPNRFVEEWIKLFLESSNVISIEDHEFKDPYIFCRDATCPGVTGYELFRYFYRNKVEKILVCNPWKRTWKS